MNHKPSMFGILMGRCLCFVAALAFLPLASRAQEPAIKPLSEFEKLRLVYVPYEELHVVLADRVERILLDRDEVIALLGGEPAKSDPAPTEFAWHRAEYRARLENQLLLLSARIVGNATTDQPLPVPLDWNPALVRQIKLNGGVATVFWGVGEEKGDARQSLNLLLTQSGPYELEMELALPVETDAARQIIRWDFPNVPVAQWELQVPGNVDIVSGAASIKREYDESLDSTTLTLLPAAGPVELVLTLNNRRRAGQLVWDSHQLAQAQLGETEDLFELELAARVVQGSLIRGEWEFDSSLELLEVQGENLREWGVLEASGQKKLWVAFQNPVTERARLRVRAISRAVDRGDQFAWSFPDWRAIDADRELRVLGVAPPPNWSVQNVSAAGMFSLDSNDAKSLFERALRLELSSMAGTLLAWYAAEPGGAINLDLQRRPGQLGVLSSVLVTATEREVSCLADLELSYTGGTCLDIELLYPPGFHIHQIDDARGPLEFQTIEHSDQGHRISLRLREPLANGTASHIVVRASRVPEGWYSEWEQHRVSMFVPHVVAAHDTRGIVALVVGGELSLAAIEAGDLIPLARQDLAEFGLRELAPQAAYEFATAGPRLEFELARLESRLAAQCVTFYRLESSRRVVHGELHLDVRQASRQRFAIRLPQDAPDAIRVALGNGRPVTELTKREIDDDNIWDVQLDSRVLGSCSLVIDYELPLPENDPFSIELAPIALADEALQSLMVCVEGSPQLDIEPTGNDAGDSFEDLPQTLYSPGRNLIGVFDASLRARAVSVKVSRRQTSPAPPIVVESADLWSDLSARGECQTLVEYRVKSTHPQMLVRMPTGSELWSLTLDDVPQHVQRVGDDLLVSFPRGSGESASVVRITYALPVNPLSWANELELLPPQLYLTDGNLKPADEVICLATNWRVSTPNGFVVADSPMGWRSTQRPTASTWAERNLQWLSELPWFSASKKEAGIARSGGISLVSPGGGAPSEGRDDAAAPQTSNDLIPMPQGESAGQSGPGGANNIQPGRQDSPQQVAPAPSQGSAGYLGFRGLDIQVDRETFDDAFHAIGSQPALSLRIANQRAQHLVAWSLCFVAIAVGLCLLQARWRARLGWVVLLLAIAIAGIWLGPVFTGVDLILEKLVWAAVALCLVYSVVSIGSTLGGLFGRMLGSSARRRTAAATLLILLPVLAWGQTQDGEQAGVVPYQIDITPRHFDDDRAIVVPFDLAAWPQVDSPRWLFPKSWYEKLVAAGQPKPAEDLISGRKFAWTQAEYRATSDGRTLSIVGTLHLLLPGDEPTELPIDISGGSVLSAEVDGAAASLFPVSELSADADKSRPADTSRALLRIVGSGEHRVLLRLEYPLEKIGGGYRVKGKLPDAFAGVVEFSLPQRVADVRWRSASIQQERHLEPNQSASFSLAPHGEFFLDWREDLVQSGPTGSANWHIDTIIEVLTHRMLAEANLRIQFGEALDSFQLLIPSGVRLESISGDNLQSWSRREDQPRLVDLQLLTPGNSTSVVVRYSQSHDPVSLEPAVLTMPLCEVVGRGTVSGRLRVLRSTLLQLDVSRADGARRVDWDSGNLKSLTSHESRPIAVVPFQSFDYVRAGVVLETQALLVPTMITAAHETVLHLGLSNCVVESRIEFDAPQGGVREFEISSPADLTMDERSFRLVGADGNTTADYQLVRDEENDRAIWRFRLPQQLHGRWAVVLKTTIATRSLNALDWQPLHVVTAADQHYQYAVVADPSLQVELLQADGAAKLLVSELGAWFDRGVSAQTPLALRADTCQHRLKLGWQRLPARIRFNSISDVTVTRRAIEETMLLEWQIQQSGIEKVEFQVPRHWNAATLSGPWIARAVRTPIDDGWVQYTVFLQDRILGDYRLALQLDSPLASSWSAGIPINLSGETVRRVVTVQNAGRDELTFQPTANVEQIVRERPLFREIQQKLEAPYLATAYIAGPADRQAGLTVRTVPRETVQTVAAAIPLSEIELSIDAGGGFVARHTMRVSNRTEPVLELKLPSAARLASLSVDGTVAAPLAAVSDPELVRIPLIKSSELDLDYPIVVVFTGRLQRAASLTEWEIPLAYTQNIETQVTHVRLYVDPALRPLWFGGTMSRVLNEGLLVDEYLDYQSKQVASISGKLLQRGEPGGTRDVQMERVEELAKELGQQRGRRLNQQQLDVAGSLQQELYELNARGADRELGERTDNFNRAKLNELVANQSARNELQDQVGEAYNFSDYFKDAGADKKPRFDQLAGEPRDGQQQGQIALIDPAVNLDPLRNQALPDLSINESRPNWQFQQADAEPSRLHSGVTLDFASEGDVFYFRVPRGKPKLTLRAVTQLEQTRAFSTAQLFAVIVGVTLLASVWAFATRRRTTQVVQ